jgi:peptidoglycan/xylan/chitin deacetylase (PgdA/CDA1 family)
LTFDDARESIIENAVPCLLELGFPASIFVPTGWPGPIDTFSRGDKKNRTLDWDQLSSLPKNGIDIHSHSVNHVDLTALDLKQLEYELRHSLETLRFRFGDRDYYLAYPFARKNQNVLDMARTVQYKGAFGFGAVLSNWRQTNPYQLKREAVLSTTTIEEFKRKIDTSYDLIRSLRIHPAQQLERLLEKLTAKLGGK